MPRSQSQACWLPRAHGHSGKRRRSQCSLRGVGWGGHTGEEELVPCTTASLHPSQPRVPWERAWIPDSVRAGKQAKGAGSKPACKAELPSQPNQPEGLPRMQERCLLLREAAPRTIASPPRGPELSPPACGLVCLTLLSVQGRSGVLAAGRALPALTASHRVEDA